MFEVADSGGTGSCITVCHALIRIVIFEKTVYVQLVHVIGHFLEALTEFFI